MKTYIGAAAVTGLLAIAPQTAMAAWELQSDTDLCGFVQTYDGPSHTQFLIVQTKKDFGRNRAALTLYNENWSIEDGDDVGQIKLDFVGAHTIENKPVAMKHGFFFHVPMATLQQIFEVFKPTDLQLVRNDQVIKSLDLEGYSSGYSKFLQCREKWEVKKGKAKRRRYLDSLPIDPFTNVRSK